jgi:hypothetical protein
MPNVRCTNLECVHNNHDKIEENSTGECQASSIELEPEEIENEEDDTTEFLFYCLQYSKKLVTPIARRKTQ